MFWMVGYNGNSIQCPYMASLFLINESESRFVFNKSIHVHHRCCPLLANRCDLQAPPGAWHIVPKSADFLAVQFQRRLITAILG
jgi:hypothetical protein